MKHLHYGWVIVGLSAVIFSFFSMRFNTFGVLLVPLTEEFQWDRGALSWAPSIAAIFTAMLSIFVARMSDKFGPRYLVTAAGLMIGTSFILMSRVQELWQALLIWGLGMGSAQSFIYIPIITTIPRWFENRQSTAIGITVTGFGLGAMIWPPVTQSLIDAFTWQNTCVILGVVDMMIIVTLAQFLIRDPSVRQMLPYGRKTKSESEPYPGRDHGMDIKTALKNPRFWLLGGALLGFFSCLNIMYVHIVAHARDIGIAPIIAASTVSIIGGASIIGRLSIGFLSDKTGVKYAMLIALTMALTALTLLLWAPWAWAFYAFAGIFGLSYGFFVPLETATPAKLFGTRSLGIIMAVMGIFTNIGITLAPPLAGAIHDATGSYRTAFFICLGLATMAFILVTVLTRLKEAPEIHKIS